MEISAVNILSINPNNPKNVFLRISPFNKKVKEIIRNCPGKICWNDELKAWEFSISQLSALENRFMKLLEQNISVSLNNKEIVENYLKAIELQKRIETPSLEDYSNNQRFYNNLDEQPKKTQRKAKKLVPVFSEEKCIYRYYCTQECGKNCPDFLSEAAGIKGEKIVVENNESSDDESLWIGKRKDSDAQGYTEKASGCFIVKAGSRMSEKYVVKLPSNAVEFRKMLQKNHIVDKDNIFTTNYPFRNMEFAAVVVSGSTSSAKTFWINENSDKAKCAGYYIEKNSPAIAVADINGSIIIGYPVPREKINFWIPEGNILPEVKKNNLNKQLKSISVQVNELKDKNGRLKAGYMFETADIAAKVLSGNMEVDSSIWILDKDCTMKTVEEIDSMRFYGDKPVYHLKQQTKGAVASLYVNDEKKFVLMKGSIVSPLLSKSISPTYKKLYRELFESGRINNHCVVVEDIVFKYSTPPAAVSCGQDMQGTKVWKTLDGECLNPENRSHKKERI